MAIGDWSLKTWQNGVDVVNATNMQRFDNKINELDTLLIPRYVIKSVDETVNNSTVLQDDNHLVATLGANSVYEIEIILSISGDSTTNFKCNWTVTGGVTQLSKRICIGGSDADTNPIYNHNGTFYSVDLISEVAYSGILNSGVREIFLLSTTTSGTLQLKWAQQTAGVVNTKLLAGSFIKIQKIIV